MRFVWLLWILVPPCAAQLSKGGFLKLLQEGNDALTVETLKKECIAFPMDAATLSAVDGREEILLALFQCLFERTGLSSDSGSSPGERARFESPRERPAPTVVVSNEALVGQKALESLRTLAVAETLEDKGERVKLQMDTKALLINLMTDHPQKVAEALENQDGQTPIPDWVRQASRAGLEAKAKGLPTLDFDVDKQTDFYGSVDQRGIRVFMSLTLMDHVSGEVESYRFEDELLMAHPSFPLDYVAEEDRFELFRLKNTEVTRVRLRKVLNAMDSLTLFPGKWLIRIVSYTGMGQIRSDSESHFQVEPGKHYQLGIEWVRYKNGIQKLEHKLEEIPDPS